MIINIIFSVSLIFCPVCNKSWDADEHPKQLSRMPCYINGAIESAVT